MNKFFFKRDESFHWYMVPVEKRELWYELEELGYEDDFEKFDDEFGRYRMRGSISNIEFEYYPEPKDQTDSIRKLNLIVQKCTSGNYISYLNEFQNAVANDQTKEEVVKRLIELLIEIMQSAPEDIFNIIEK